MAERMHINSRTTKIGIAFVAGCLLIAGAALYMKGANPGRNTQVPPVPQLSMDQKYAVLGALDSSSATSTGVGTSSGEGKKQTVRAVSQTSATSTQSDSDKLKILRSLQQ